MDYVRLVISTVMSILLNQQVTEVQGGAIRIKNNGYSQILIAIAENVPENSTLIDNIKTTFTKASSFLYKVTK